MELRDIQDDCYISSFNAGWWNDATDDIAVKYLIGTKLALVHSEISEAMEGFRKDLMDDHLPHRKMAEVELADAVIRILDLAGFCGFDIESAIEEKMEYNAKRADHKLENRAKEGGKKF